jgi:hypothetical protein
MNLRKYVLAMMVVVVYAAVSLSCSLADLSIWSITDDLADPLYRFVENGKAGYIDNKGKVVISPTFKDDGSNFGDEFHDGLLEVFGVGYVDKSGKLVIPTKTVSPSTYDRTYDFSDGLALISVNDLFGFIDRKGNVVIKPQYETAAYFSNGMANVERGERSGYIGKDGAFAITPVFFRGRDFHEDRAWVVAEGPCRWQQYFDERARNPDSRLPGAELFAFPTWDSCFGSYTLPKSSMQVVELNLRCRYALIDKTGTILSSERFDDVQEFSEGLAPVKMGKLWGYADRSGRIVITPQFEIANGFSNGLAAVAITSSPRSSGMPVFGYINRSGDFVIPPQFVQAQNFSEGLAVVGDDRQVWFVDVAGHTPIAGKFDAAGRFFKGLAHVELSHTTSSNGKNELSKFAYIDRSGRAVFRYSNTRER